jgi:multidrug efflux system membrane fusion protein
VKLKAEFPNPNYQLWPGQFVSVRLKVETLSQVLVVPTSAVQRGPAGTFSYVIGEGDIAHARPITVTQQDEKNAVIAKGLGASDRVVTTGFANLADGAKVSVGSGDQTITPDLAPRKRERRGAKGQQGQGDHGGRKGRAGDHAKGADKGADDAAAKAQPANGGKDGGKAQQ